MWCCCTTPGGDRAQTVAALDRIIPQLQAEGVRFTTVSAGAGLPAADFPASPTQLLMGRIMLGAVAVAGAIVAALEWSLLLGGGLVLLRLVLMMVVAVRHGRRRRGRSTAGRCGTGWSPGPVSVVVPGVQRARPPSSPPCARWWPATIRSKSSWWTTAPPTAPPTRSRRSACPRCGSIRKPNGGKPSALNAGIAAARHEIVVLMDGDTVFEPATIRRPGRAVRGSARSVPSPGTPGWPTGAA